MIKKVLISLSLVTLLTACSNNENYESPPKIEKQEIVGTIENAQIAEVRRSLKPLRYTITLRKNKEFITLNLRGKQIADSLHEGTHITVSYNKDMYVEEIKFSVMEEK